MIPGMELELAIALAATLVPSLAGILSSLVQTANDKKERAAIARDASRQGEASATAAREILLRLTELQVQEDVGTGTKEPTTGAQSVLAASTSSWSDENATLVTSANNRRQAAAKLNRSAAVIGSIAAVIFTLGILWALVTQQPVQALSATLGLIPGAVSALVLEQAKRATDDARADEAALRAQVHYQRRAAYALEAVSLIKDPNKRDDALTSLAIALGPGPGAELAG